MDDERESRIFALLAQGIDKYPGVSETLERMAATIQLCLYENSTGMFSPEDYNFVDRWLDSLTFTELVEVQAKIDKRMGKKWP